MDGQCKQFFIGLMQFVLVDVFFVKCFTIIADGKQRKKGLNKKQEITTEIPLR
jgi:hypothetical protein